LPLETDQKQYSHRQYDNQTPDGDYPQFYIFLFGFQWEKFDPLTGDGLRNSMKIEAVLIPINLLIIKACFRFLTFGGVQAKYSGRGL
jgi:hypothetical protein